MLFQGFPIARRDVLRNGPASDCSRAGSKGFQQYEDGGVYVGIFPLDGTVLEREMEGVVNAHMIGTISTLQRR